MRPPKVVATRRLPTSLLHKHAEAGHIELVEWAPAGKDGANDVDASVPASRAWLLEHCKDAAGILVMLGDRVDTELLETAGKQLKVISTMSVGYDHIDIKALKASSVRLGYTPNVLTSHDLSLGFLGALGFFGVADLAPAARFGLIVRAGAAATAASVLAERMPPEIRIEANLASSERIAAMDAAGRADRVTDADDAPAARKATAEEVRRSVVGCMVSIDQRI